MKPLMRSLILLLCGMLCAACCFAQDKIHGTVKDSTGKPVWFATVSLKKKASNAIVSYSVTDGNGAYTLVVPAGEILDSLLVEVRCIGYKSLAKSVTGKAPVDFILQVSVNQLQSVVVKSHRPVLRINGDTLS
jgi:Carboxypeptidase regulatory-like domain